ncbi:MATE family efflux transporter [Lichenihabitans sp. PAMC28606]|uniref:MATE family efflux transporter n=1 Tax=Lichenihabitans sp. PAMC28606 TaxID=2880932 RepID=UPI001D0A3DF7|nr:MATE family efflux transporter [Lichenihabitans sp. PAMC28606]UDL93776.1 MATE family efflux transporter [Lichenihabitans sp. PAMC28606]
MTGTSTIGVIAIFVVDFLSLVYVSHLHQIDLTAAVGFATQVLFYPVSINIGLTIGVTALVARALGAGDRDRARRLAASGLVLSCLFSAVVASVVLIYSRQILSGLGAVGPLRDVAERFLQITLPANVAFAAGMVLSGILRAVGDARRAMYVTLAGGIVTGIIDPILIFGLHFGVYGAAISTVVSRLVFLGVGYWGAVRVHNLVGRPSVGALMDDLRPVMNIALPAMATNLATPVANSYVLHVFAKFGQAAIAATTVTDRVVPVAFGVIFALTGAVGPILGQNLGAGLLERVRRTLTTSFVMTAVYVLSVWFILWVCSSLIASLFDATAEARTYIEFFCTFGVSAWLFIGFLFVANASFNNLGYPILSLVFNWGRASLGTIPFVTIGAAYGGVEGGQLGIAFGAAIFGLSALATAYAVSGRLAKRHALP